MEVEGKVVEGGKLFYQSREKEFVGEVSVKLNGTNKTILMTLVVDVRKTKNGSTYLNVLKARAFLSNP